MRVANTHFDNSTLGDIFSILQKYMSDPRQKRAEEIGVSHPRSTGWVPVKCVQLKYIFTQPSPLRKWSAFVAIQLTTPGCV